MKQNFQGVFLKRKEHTENIKVKVNIDSFYELIRLIEANVYTGQVYN